MADINFSRSSGASAGWLVGGAVVLFLVLITVLGFSTAGPAPDDSQPAIEAAPAAPAQPAID